VFVNLAFVFEQQIDIGLPPKNETNLMLYLVREANKYGRTKVLY